MQSPQQTLEHLLNGEALSEAEAGRLLEQLTAGDLAPALAGALLAAVRAKGVVAAELRGFADAMRSLARKPALPADLDAIDIVGTGGDFSGSLNLSTGAALLAASCGLPVVKHGNRSVTSKSGSADLIEQLGLALPLDEQRSATVLREHRVHVPVRPLFSSGDEGAGAGAGGSRRAHGAEFARAAYQSGGAALPADRCLRRGQRPSDCRCVGRYADRARLGRAWRERLGRGDAGRHRSSRST